MGVEEGGKRDEEEDNELVCVRRRRHGCFFFKQKTAYEMLRSLVGSEMCIRDSTGETQQITPQLVREAVREVYDEPSTGFSWRRPWCCLLYTSDAADDLLCVDLGGRRII